jgi:AcrB/AcrD/AcrF family
LPELRDVASDQQAGGATLTLTIDRDQEARFGIQPQLIDDTLYDAFGQRQVAQYFTQLNSYHVVLEVLPEMQPPGTALDSIYVNSPNTGEAVPLSTFVKWTRQPTNFLSINHQSMYPSVTLSFNLASGVALGQATTAIQNAEAQLGAPATLIGNFQGNAQAFQASLASEPLLVAAAIIVIYIILGVLYESYVHPLTILSTLPSAGLGALVTLMLFGYDFSLIALIGIILLIGIVKKNGIMLHRFRDRGAAQSRSGIHRRDPGGVSAALPADHDDDDGRTPRRCSADARRRHRGGDPPTAWLRHCRWSNREPSVNALHDANRLPLPRPSQCVVHRRFPPQAYADGGRSYGSAEHTAWQARLGSRAVKLRVSTCTPHCPT